MMTYRQERALRKYRAHKEIERLALKNKKHKTFAEKLRLKMSA